MSNENIKEIIKATLFVSGDGIEISAFADKLQLSEKKLEKYIDSLKEELSNESGIHLVRYKNKIQLCSNPDYSNLIADILNPIREKALTKAALETMAIIAYKQPVTRLEIEEIRGVGCDYTVQLLLDNNLIEVVGRKDVIGRPLLFGTTDEFLKRFELENIDDLPEYDELLERIKIIETEQSSDSLYRDFKLPDVEETPDFLKDEEDIQTIESSESE